MLRYLALVAPLALVACSSMHPVHVAAPVTETKPAPARAEAPRTDTIVLFDDETSTALDPNGAELGSERTQRIAVGQDVLSVKQEIAKDTLTCDITWDTGEFHNEGEFFSKSLVLTSSSKPDLVIVPPAEKEKEPNTVVEDKRIASIQAVVGPYVFVQVAGEFFGCGAAHPVGGTSASVWNVRLGTEVELTPPDGTDVKAAEALKDRGYGDTITLVEARPRFDPHGHLTISWRYEKATYYADSDGEGHAYTVSTWVTPEELPSELAEMADPPPALASYLQKHPGPISGWSRLD